MPVVRQPALIIPTRTVQARGNQPAVFIPARSVAQGDSPMMVARPIAGRMRQNLFQTGDPHNIPNAENRPEPVGYNGITPVSHIIKRSLRGEGGVGTLSREIDSGLVSKNYQSIKDQHHYAVTITEAPNFAVPTTAGGVLCLTEPDGVRSLLSVRNVSAAANVFLAFGTIPTANSVFRLAPNEIFLWDTVVPQGDMYAIADAASGAISFSYSNLNY